MMWRALMMLGFAVAFAALALTSCDRVGGVSGSGREATEDRPVPAFSGVRTGESVEVITAVGQPQRVTVSADDNILPLLRTQVRDGILVIDAEKEYRSKVHPPRITITAPALTSFEASGSATVSATGLAGNGLLRASGSARIDAAGVAAESLRVEASGSARVTARGVSASLRVEASGAGRVELADLAARTVEVQGSGSAAIELKASETISGRLSGSATARYSGAPRVSVSTEGSATISSR